MLTFTDFFSNFAQFNPERAAELAHLVEQKLAKHNDGNLRRWQQLLASPATINTQTQQLDQSWIKIGRKEDVSPQQLQQIDLYIQGLMPWRKGPFELFDIRIDSEWRSDFKWQRIAKHLSPMQHQLILDVGCGNGYHCLRMQALGAKLVMGIDPAWLSVCQFQLLNHYLKLPNVNVLPFTLEEMPTDLQLFDKVFSMGVLYHRRSPLDHIAHLHSTLNVGGEMILETLVIDGKLGEVLVPEGRYAQMNNVWFLPSIATLESWCVKMGFEQVRCIDINQTSVEEQRSTAYKPGTSLSDYLDRDNPNLTIEGHPAPIRATIVAKKSNARLKRYT